MDVVAPSPLPSRCAVHPDLESSAICERCGGFLCEACRGSVDGRTLCAACVDRHHNLAPSRRSRVALILALLGLPSVVGGLLGWLELRAIRRGAAPPAGEGYARLACALGGFYGLLVAVAVLTWYGG